MPALTISQFIQRLTARQAEQCRHCSAPVEVPSGCGAVTIACPDGRQFAIDVHPVAFVDSQHWDGVNVDGDPCCKHCWCQYCGIGHLESDCADDSDSELVDPDMIYAVRTGR